MIITKIKTIYLLYFFFLFFLYSCISDNYDNCYGIRLFINYPQEQERCEKLDIYVFDQKGSLFAKYEKTGRQVQPGVSFLLQVPEGQYSIVVWGDVRGIFSYVQNTTPERNTQQHSQVKKELFTSDFWCHRVVTKFRQKELGVLSESIEPLFYASEYRVDLKANETKTIHLDFVKNTNQIKLKVSGLPADVSYAKLELGVAASNWQYYFNNSIPDGTEEIRYEPYEKRIEEYPSDRGKVVVADLSVLRLIQGRKPLLYIRNGETGEVLYQRNLVELLLQLPYTNLDKEDYFEIDLDFSGPTISIKVNGWNVVDNNQDIS